MDDVIELMVDEPAARLRRSPKPDKLRQQHNSTHFSTSRRGPSVCFFLLVYASFTRAVEDCLDRKWPALDLFVPVHLHASQSSHQALDRNNEFVNFFLRTYMLFWPDHANSTLRVLLDEEVKGEAVFEAFRTSVASLNPPRLEFSFIAQSPWYRGQGGLRQQYSMFWADNFTDAEFIGFVDSDGALITMVDREDLFENGKPVVNGRFGVETRAPWRNVPITTWAITGKEEPMRCMSYFPVVVHRAHLALIRAHITSHLHKRTFDEAFQSFSGYFSQFNIMCTILFWDEQLRSQYTWYVHDFSPSWDGSTNPKPLNGQWADRSIFSRNNPNMFGPKPRIAVHARWHNHWERNALTIYTDAHMFTEFLQRGICDSPPFPKQQAYCFHWQSMGRVSYNSSRPNGDRFTGYNREMHSFEFVDYYETANETQILQFHQERIARIQSCPGSPRQPLIEQVL